MSNKSEMISALADEQLNNDAFNELLASPDLQNEWQLHHRVKSALNGDDVSIADDNFAKNIAAMIDAEPTILAPKNSLKSHKLIRQIGQFAIAASVAAVAILGVQQFEQESQPTNLQVLATQPIAGNAAPVSLKAMPKQNTNQLKAEEEARRLEQKLRINAYFQDHELQNRIQQPAQNAQAN